MNIYVGNLSYNTNEDDLKKIFEAHGEVASAKIITDKFTQKSKGFGFVDMPNNDEAKNAIAELDGKDLGGRNMKVNESKPRPDRNRY